MNSSFDLLKRAFRAEDMEPITEQEIVLHTGWYMERYSQTQAILDHGKEMCERLLNLITFANAISKHGVSNALLEVANANGAVLEMTGWTALKEITDENRDAVSQEMLGSGMIARGIDAGFAAIIKFFKAIGKLIKRFFTDVTMIRDIRSRMLKAEATRLGKIKPDDRYLDITYFVGKYMPDTGESPNITYQVGYAGTVMYLLEMLSPSKSKQWLELYELVKRDIEDGNFNPVNKSRLEEVITETTIRTPILFGQHTHQVKLETIGFVNITDLTAAMRDWVEVNKAVDAAIAPLQKLEKETDRFIIRAKEQVKRNWSEEVDNEGRSKADIYPQAFNDAMREMLAFGALLETSVMKRLSAANHLVNAQIFAGNILTNIAKNIKPAS